MAKHLDGDAFAAALRSGIHRVLSQQELLNRINVFPVADSDTGTNLALSLGSALGVLNRDGEKHLGTMLASLDERELDAFSPAQKRPEGFLRHPVEVLFEARSEPQAQPAPALGRSGGKQRTCFPIARGHGVVNAPGKQTCSVVFLSMSLSSAPG